MAYIGRGLDKLSNVDVLDAITFTNSAGPYNITKSSTAFIPSAIQNLLIEVDGVIQASDSYTISGSTITFGVSMSSSLTMNSFLHFGMGVSMTPTDGSVSTAKIVDDAVTTSKILNANVTNAKLGTDISADKLVAGTVTDARLPTTMAGKTLTTANVSATTLTAAGDGSSADGKITLNCSQNTHGVKIQSPSHASAQTYTLTLPTTAPVADRILQTDGSGNLSFAEVSGGTSWQTVVTASTLTAVAGRGYPINTTSNACTVTLPASASAGDTIKFVDYARNWGTNAVTINQNSLNFQGGTSPNPVYDTTGESISITYVDATKGWIPTNDGAVAFETPTTYSLDFLVVAGGGGSGGQYAGGGGAGGYRTSTQTHDTGVAITVTVGDGGAAASYSSSGTAGTNGNDSSISGTGVTTITSTGGGGSSGDGGTTGDGGSGGGGGNGNSGGSGDTPSTSPSQGNDGGSNSGATGGAGGGGIAGAGAGASGYNGGNGGAGNDNSISGSSVGYAGGGGGGRRNGGGSSSAGSATHGGGAGSAGTAAATAGTVNTGGGGGGASGGYSGGAGGQGGDGGKGVVVISVPDASYSGTTTGSPTVATGQAGSKTTMVFTGTGSYTT